MLVKFSTIAGGVFIEQRDEQSYSADTRCFRFAGGFAEYAFYGDLISNNPFPRWYGHVNKPCDFQIA